MHPTQFSSCATYMGDQPSLLVAVRYAKTSTGQTFRQNPHALHISSPITTSQRPAGPRDAFFSALNSAIQSSPAAQHTLTWHAQRAGLREVTTYLSKLGSGA